MDRGTRPLARLACAVVLTGPLNLPVDDPPAVVPPESGTDVGGEEAPVPAGAYADQAALQPAPVLRSSVQAAERKVAGAQRLHQQILQRLATARSRHAEFTSLLQSLESEAGAATRELAAAESRMQERAVAAFVSGEIATSAVVSSLEAAQHDSVLDLTTRRVLVGAALDQDGLAIDGYLDLRARLEREALATLDSVRAMERAIGGLTTEAAGRRPRSTGPPTSWRRTGQAARSTCTTPCSRWPSPTSGL
jgi:hypothetical protein